MGEVDDAIYKQVEASINKHREMKFKAMNDFSDLRKRIDDTIRKSTNSLLVAMTTIAAGPSFVLALFFDDRRAIWMAPAIMVPLLFLLWLIFVFTKSSIELTQQLCPWFVRNLPKIDRIIEGIAAAAEHLPLSLRSRAAEVRDQYSVTTDDVARLNAGDLRKLKMVYAFSIVGSATSLTVASLIVWFYRAPA